MDTSGEFTAPVVAPEIMESGGPIRPEKAQELGLTDSVWDMTVRCLHQDPARRPTIIEVAQLLRKWSVSSLSALDPRYDTLPVASCYMLWIWIRFLYLQLGGLESRISQPDS